MKVKVMGNAHDRLYDESSHPELMVGHLYTVVGINYRSFRIINGSGSPVLYEKEIFDVVDSNIPKHWVRIDYEDGEYFIDPPEFAEPGFYEDYFDNVPSAVERFHLFKATLEPDAQ